MSFGDRRDLEPQRLVSGKPYDEWTPNEVIDAHLWRLGPRFRTGLTPPPEPHYSSPPIPGSASDTGSSWRGSMAGYEGSKAS
jgi:hypothetical protein